MIDSSQFFLYTIKRILELYHGLKEDLSRISDEIELANASAPSPTRPRACNSFNPRCLESSVSV